MSRLHAIALSCAILVAPTAPAFAQFSAPTLWPNEGLRRTQPAVTAPRPGAAAPGFAQPNPAPRGMAAVSASPEPTYDESTIDRIAAAINFYAAIEQRGGWPTLPAEAAKLAPGSTGAVVAALRQRLAISGDLRDTGIDAYDAALIAAVKRFQARHGVPETGQMGPLTLAALNVPAATRVRQLTASLDRLASSGFKFSQRYVVVNIPAAVAEAVVGGQVEHRYVAIVGKPDRPSPTVTTLITMVNLNPTWTVPLSIAKKDVVPRVRKDPTYLAKMHMRLLDAQGNEIDPSTVDWSQDRAPNFTIRQDPGAWNSLGFVRIDMPNPHSVYMHDTPHRELFGSGYRFHSSGCARIGDVRALAAWLLQDNASWGRREIDAAIATGARTDVRLARPVPVAWIYLTGWATRDGTVHFRNDIYNHDDLIEKRFMVSLPKPLTVSAATPARASGFMLQSADTRPAGIVEVSYLDNR